MSQQHAALVVEGLTHGAGAILDPGAIERRGAGPLGRLSVEVAEVGVGPGLEEGLADVADGALDPALLIAAGDGDGARLEAVVRRQSQQRGVEPDRVAVALDDGALEVVVEQHARDAAEVGKRLDVPAHEEGHGRAREEAQEDPPRVTEHHDEGQSGRSARPTASLPKCAQSTCACSPGSVRSRWNASAGFLGRRRPITRRR
ncbi:hypothetical protein [Sorangium sp. So ce341]|uniref:hypothetical protein n=1 Tax=Sorangium sp. So ce341 TaxID=3133302 RepID=UPI003F5DDEAF